MRESASLDLDVDDAHPVGRMVFPRLWGCIVEDCQKAARRNRQQRSVTGRKEGRVVDQIRPGLAAIQAEDDPVAPTGIVQGAERERKNLAVEGKLWHTAAGLAHGHWLGPVFPAVVRMADQQRRCWRT